MKVGVDSFVAAVTDPDTERVVGPVERFEHLMEEIETADRAGLYSYGIGEHHRAEYYDAAPAIILAAAASRTRTLRLRSAVTVLSAADPVRVFQEYATVDLISGGRVELVVGRGSFTEAFPLFGLSFADYDELFEEKLDLLVAAHPQRARDVVGPPPPGAERPAGVPRARPRTRCRSGSAWAAPRSRSCAPGCWPPADGRDHRRRAAAVRPADRPLPPRRRAGRAPSRAAEGRAALLRVPRRRRREGDQLLLPGWEAMFTTIARERGGMPPTRRQFDATRGPDGAYIVGDPDQLAAKLARISEQLAGVDRVNLQMTNPRLRHADLLHSIEPLGEVGPKVADV